MGHIVIVMFQDVCQDASLRLTVTKLVSPDQLVVVLFLTNQKQAPLNGVSLSTKPSSNLLVSQWTLVSRPLSQPVYTCMQYN